MGGPQPTETSRPRRTGLGLRVGSWKMKQLTRVSRARGQVHGRFRVRGFVAGSGRGWTTKRACRRNSSLGVSQFARHHCDASQPCEPACRTAPSIPMMVYRSPGGTGPSRQGPGIFSVTDGWLARYRHPSTSTAVSCERSFIS